VTDFPSFSDDAEKRIVYVRGVKASDLPDEIRARTGGAAQLYAIHAPSGEVLAIVPDRAHAFLVARQNSFSPVSVH
jgi:hypothetical protein